MTSPLPSRRIRASYDKDYITVYQAYNTQIAQAAVAAQRLDASPLYAPSRMTWIKPSWNWMLYRSGYSYKDPNQACILALKMKHEYFLALLRLAVLAGEQHSKGQSVVVQWDPERGPRLEKLEGERSIQIGIPGDVRMKWIEEWIEGIEDVTDRARQMKRVLDEEGDIGVVELVERGLMPEEREYEVPANIVERLHMTTR